MKNIQYYLAGMERLTIAAVVVTKSASLTGCYRGLYSCIGLPFSKRKDMHQNPMIVFVCEHGAAKSILAAAYFNELARERNLGLTAIARGTNPDAELSAKTITGLREDGLTSTESIPIRLTREEIESAQRVV